MVSGSAVEVHRLPSLPGARQLPHPDRTWLWSPADGMRRRTAGALPWWHSWSLRGDEDVVWADQDTFISSPPSSAKLGPPSDSGCAQCSAAVPGSLPLFFSMELIPLLKPMWRASQVECAAKQRSQFYCSSPSPPPPPLPPHLSSRFSIGDKI